MLLLGLPPPKDKDNLKKQLRKLADALKRLAGKVVEALPATLRSAAGAILGFLSEALGLAVEHTWVWNVLVASFTGIWLMQKVNNRNQDNSLKLHDLLKL